MVLVFGGHGAQAGCEELRLILGYGVAHVVGRRIAFVFQSGEIALELGAEDVEERREEQRQEGVREQAQEVTARSFRISELPAIAFT